jgi:hypothetical protein
MLRLSLVLLVVAIAAGVYAIAAPSVFANVLAFGSITALYLSMLNSKRTA